MHSFSSSLHHCVFATKGREAWLTREIREDGRGRHTTVTRELIPLPGGAGLPPAARRLNEHLQALYLKELTGRESA